MKATINELNLAPKAEDAKRPSGIDILGDVPWGTHFTYFYHTSEDLTKILVPYFKAGLENNEYCIWVTSEPLEVDEAKRALEKAVTNLQDYFGNGQIEIIPHTDWYLKGGYFDQERVLSGWVSKLEVALDNGFNGLRLTGNTFWLEKDNWRDFVEYERVVDSVIGNYKMIAICTYSLERCSPAEVIDIVSAHQFAVVEREGELEMIESSGHVEARKDLDKQLSFTKSVLETVDALVLVRDSRGAIKEFNRQGLEITGLDMDSVRGKQLSNMVPSEEAEELERLYIDLTSGNFPHKHENYLLTQDGERRLISWSCTVTQAQDGLIENVISTGIDITESRQNEAELARLASFPRLNPFPIFETDSSGKVTFVNPASKKLFPDLESSGASHPMLFDFDSLKEKIGKSKNKIFLRDVGIGNRTYQQAAYMVPESDSIRFYNADITERKKADQALRESEERLSRAQEIAHLGSWELDLVDNVLTWSDEVYRIFGLEPQQFAATYEAFLDAVHPDNRQAVDDAYSDSVREGKDGYEIEHRVVRKSTGEIRFVHEKCYNVRDESGQIIKSIGMIHDITERKKAEEQLEKTLKDLGRSNQELEQFAYIASHDLQEPLRMVASYLQLIEKRYKNQLDKDADDFINFAVDGSRRMQNMINGLLAYSRVGTKGKPFEATNCEEILGLAMANLQTAIEDSDAKITHDTLPTVKGDAAQLVQLFQNLIGNAINFRSDETPLIHISADEKGDEVVFSMRDNGVGFSQEYANRIFEIFERLHDKEHPGTGIGLAVCRRIVERHAGRIWAQSTPGKGSTFYFIIPKRGD